MWYFDVFNNNNNPGPGGRPTLDRNLGGNPEVPATSNSSGNDSPDQIILTDNQTSNVPQINPTNDAVAEMNRRMESFSSSSSSSSQSIPESLNRFKVLDQLEQLNQDNTAPRPDSPTGSIDSSETVRPYKVRKGKGVSIRRLGK